MAIETSRKTVGTTATLLYAHPLLKSSSDGDQAAKHVALINTSGVQAAVVIGASDVTTSSGARWTVASGLSLSLDIEPGESLYGIVATGTQDIDVLVNGR